MQNFSSLEIQYRDPSELQPNPENPRRHSQRQIKQICRSIAEFGFLVPVLVDDGGTLIAGHARVLAAGRLGLTRIPTVKVSHLSAIQKTAFTIAENKLNENAEWNHKLLGEQLKLLAESNITCDGAEITGFAPAEIDLLIEELEIPNSDQRDAADEVPEISSQAVSRVGDLWILGRHRLLCGSALEERSYQKLLEDDRAAMIFADPPFNVRIRGHVSGLGKICHREFAMASGELDQPAFIEFLTCFLTHSVRFSKSGTVFDVCIDWRHVLELTQASHAAGLSMLNIAVWVKSNPGMGSLYRSQYELVFVMKVGDGSHKNNIQLGKYGRGRSNVWNYPSAVTFSRTSDEGNLLKLHPTVKPVRLVADAILDCSSRNDVILDPFLGSGTTLVAAQRVGRRCYGIELDPLYVDTAVRRWQTFTGQQAILTDGNCCFESVAVQRSYRDE